MPDAKRPYVVCHMVPSLDGRIVPTGWKLPARVYKDYERTAATFGANAWMIGRISMEPYAGKARIAARSGRGSAPTPIPRKDFVATRDAKGYAIALDPSGKLRWESAFIDEEHVVTVLTERVPDAYLAFLRSKGVSYLFGGKARVDLKKVLAKLRAAFGIERLLLEGGGKINGSFLEAGLIDEVSVLLAPFADGTVGTPTLFDAARGGRARALKLLSVERLPADLVWLRYKVTK
jgi:2,5-diamino-6-(ribosylamino)-4(3H)-pyrimidinone 5'-phosphate reductase